LIKGDNVKPVFGFASQKYGGCYLLDQRLWDPAIPLLGLRRGTKIKEQPSRPQGEQLSPQCFSNHIPGFRDSLSFWLIWIWEETSIQVERCIKIWISIEFKQYKHICNQLETWFAVVGCPHVMNK
jgi:hypothetical protein